MKHNNTEMAQRLIEKLKVDSEAPDAGRADEAAPGEPPVPHARMATPADAPPGIELDEHGDPVPLGERSEQHRAEAKTIKP